MNGLVGRRNAIEGWLADWLEGNKMEMSQSSLLTSFIAVCWLLLLVRNIKV